MSKEYKYGEKSFPNGYNPFVIIFFYRFLAEKTAFLLNNIHFITPNKITVSGLIVFIISTYLISFHSGYNQIIGLILGPIWVFIDYLDGSLARIRESESILGKKLDALQDHFAFFLIPVSAFINLSNHQYVNYYFIILIIILFNQYLYAVGIRELYADGQLPFFRGSSYEKMNLTQKKILEKTKINIGFHTFIQGDTLFVLYWISVFFGLSFLSLIHFFLWSVIRNILLFYSYLKKIK